MNEESLIEKVLKIRFFDSLSSIHNERFKPILMRKRRQGGHPEKVKSQAGDPKRQELNQ